MKFLTKKNTTQKIILALIIAILVNFSIPPISCASQGIGMDLLTELVHLVASLGDVVMGLLNKTMLGTDSMWTSVMLEQSDINLQPESTESYLHVSQEDLQANGAVIKKVNSDKLDGLIWDEWKIPNTLYCPENIFANNIAALDVNFIHPNQYTAVEYDETGSTATEKAAKTQQSAASTLNSTISSWYKAFRNISIVGLLSVLVYLGIRLLLSAAATEKAKYKETMRDWLVALCLIFVIHIIMSGILMITQKITDLFGTTAEKGIIVEVVDTDDNGNEVQNQEPKRFKTNLTGYVRFLAQSKEFGDAAGYTIIYVVLVIFTVMFTVTYLKRFLYMAFFTMIAPLVSLTYPIDKIGDGKAQAFNMWVREYFMNAIIQPVHLLLYTVLVTSAYDLVTENIIYGCVAIGFLIPAEKFIKKMFKLDKAETTSGLGAVAGGALAWKGINALTNKVKGKVDEGSGGGNKDKIRTADNQGYLEDKKRKKTSTPKDSTEILGEEADGANGAGGADDSDNEPRTGSIFTDEDRNRKQELEDKYDENQLEDLRNRYNDPFNPLSQEEREDINEFSDLERRQLEQERLNDEEVRIQQEIDEQEKNEDLSGFSDEEKQQYRDLRRKEINGEQLSRDELEKYNKFKRKADAGSYRNRFRCVGHALSDMAGLKADRMKNRINKALTPEGLKKGIIKGAKTIGRIGGAAAGATLVGTAAAGAAVATGDLTKGAGIIAGGTLAGIGVGSGIGGKGFEKAAEKATDFSSIISDAWKTDQEKAQAKEAKNAQFDSDFKLDEKNVSYLRKQGINNPKEWLADSKTQSFLDAGITDINTIYNARKLMDESNGRINIEGAVTRAKAASELSDSFASSPTQQDSMKKDLRKRSSSRVSDDQIHKYVEDLKAIKKKN